MQWVTWERPQIDRIACPWLVARFITSRSGATVGRAVRHLAGTVGRV
ncbi:chromate resistance protein ChrB domain-containing protein [Rhodanobacter sp. FW106-PBR-R2A-1-13]